MNLHEDIKVKLSTRYTSTGRVISIETDEELDLKTMRHCWSMRTAPSPRLRYNTGRTSIQNRQSFSILNNPSNCLMNA